MAGSADEPSGCIELRPHCSFIEPERLTLDRLGRFIELGKIYYIVFI